MAGFLKSVLTVVAGAVIAGVILDEAGRGKLGNLPKMIAQKATRGFGISEA